MPEILILIPTLHRLGKLRPLAENIRDATESGYTTVLITEAEDEASCMEAAALEDEGLVVAVINNRKACYAGAMNAGYDAAVSDGIAFTHVLQGADDLLFHPGWDKPALTLMETRPDVQIAGTNDMHEPGCLAGKWASHYLISRRYIDETGSVIDQPPGIVLCEAYEHAGCLSEFYWTIATRGAWAPCLDSIVEHRHHDYGLSVRDDTYEKQPRFEAADNKIFSSRQHLWSGP